VSLSGGSDVHRLTAEGTRINEKSGSGRSEIPQLEKCLILAWQFAELRQLVVIFFSQLKVLY